MKHTTNYSHNLFKDACSAYLNIIQHPIHKLIATTYGIILKDVYQMGECLLFTLSVIIQ